jgi:uncharacterized membrane protein YuzA (DUF378 family)
MNLFTQVCLVLAIIGAINWGLVGFANLNLINAIFGGPAHPGAGWFSRLIYALVGLAGVGLIGIYSSLREAPGEGVLERRKAEARV